MVWIALVVDVEYDLNVSVVDGLGRREDGPTMKGEGGVFVKKDFVFGVYKTR